MHLHAARALQLTADQRRASPAAAIEHLVGLADMPPLRLATVPVCRGEVKAATGALLVVSLCLEIEE